MKYLSVCSGIEAATVAWHPIGWEPLAFSEIESFPRKVLAHHYPDVPLHGDFTVLREQDWIVDADVLVGGTPCQAFSVAGLRQSLSDDRGNLTLEFVRLANAIDDLRHAANRPASIIVWENVPGVLSVSDNAFGCFLAALVGDDTPFIPTGGKWTNAGMVIGRQRSAAWRVLDAQYFGVAQRRRRVFVVASARDGFDPAEVLFEREGMRRDTPPSRKPGEEPSATIAARFGISRNNHEECVVGALGARTGLSRGVQDAESGHLMPIGLGMDGDVMRDDLMETITSREGSVSDTSHAVAQPITFGAQMSEPQTDVDMAQTLQAKNPMAVAQPIAMRESGQGYWMEDEVAGTLRAEGEDRPSRPSHVIGQPIAFSSKDHGADASVDLSPTLRAMPHNESHANGGGQMAVAQPIAIHPHVVGRSATSGPQGKEYLEDGSAYTMDATGVSQSVAQPMTFQDTADCLTSAYGTKWNGNAAATNGSLFAAHPIGGVDYENNAHSMSDPTGPLLKGSPSGGGRPLPAVVFPMAVRRLTPRECERLQGFPDDYTAIPGGADGPRYKALGNSMAVPVMHWIGKRIVKNI